MEIIDSLMSQTSPLAFHIIYVLGIYTLICILYNTGSFLFVAFYALCSAISVTHCALTSAKQKALANNTEYTSKPCCAIRFIWKNFMIHLSAEGPVIYDSPDFRWKSIFDYDTYTTHIRKTIQK